MSQKHHTWTLHKRLANLSSLPWLYFGDFNEILWPCEKIGGNDRDVSLMKNFREAVKECNLMDLGSSGCLITWSNKRYGHGLIEERLDRFLCNKEWGNIFLESVEVTLEMWTSDHNPIVMIVVEKRRGLRYKRRNFPGCITNIYEAHMTNVER